jgi:2-keto-4-pentenoate hydratase/2-oxohepta-3-ene-1,7-dioic acid hydratase in catechol pathway
MRYVTFKAQGRISYGVAQSGGIVDLGARLGKVLPDLKAYLHAGALGLTTSPFIDAPRDYVAGEFSYEPVIPNPDKVLCVGLNYEDHRRETGRPAAAHPSIFTRFADTLIGHGAPILLPSVSTALDYEGELAVIVGKQGFRVPESEAAKLVAGYACFNDGTLRDWQRHTHQFTPGKNFRATGPLGPELVSPDEIERLEDEKIETRLNGVVMQSASLGEMIFSIPRIISYVSNFTKLSPGDIIATGTPGGVGFARDIPICMKAGDQVEVSIGGVGRLVNPIESDADGD